MRSYIWACLYEETGTEAVP